MSSHHFVREAQEMIVAVMKIPVSSRILNETLEWSPYVAAWHEAAKWLFIRGIHPDAVFIEKDNQLSVDFLPTTSVFECMHYQADLERLLQNSRGLPARTLYIFVDNDMFKPLSQWAVHHLSSFAIQIFTERKRYQYCRDSYKKWAVAGTEVEILPSQTNKGEQQWDIKSGNAKLNPGTTLLLQWQEAGPVHLKSNIPFWVAEPAITGDSTVY